MVSLTISQKQDFLNHMTDDQSTLIKKFKARKTPYYTRSIGINELDDYIAEGWEEVSTSKHKAKIQKLKPEGVKLEDDIWCMFYNLGFRNLNYDEDLSVQWGDNPEDRHQLDVVAVGDEAIFVVECKATAKLKPASFKKEIGEICLYRDGVIKALRQIYGDEKKVKFIFATRNYTFAEGCDDEKRLADNKIFQFTDNTYDYINSLIKSYKSTAIYQFYGLMFKHERINKEKIRIPALKGTMGGHNYYMLSIEPAKLLKIGFVLHRTKVNTQITMPTYQRLLVPSRLKGIGEFIDKGGYFPNTIIVNFDDSNKKNRIQFEQAAGGSDDTKTKLGYLTIPNAYCIAYIIDGQHRVYGYAGSKYKDTNTIPVVAFDGLPSEEQLRIFMDINEHQKAVNPGLRLDLTEDLNWDSPRLDSRLKALRSSIIKQLGSGNNSVLSRKISIGEDSAKLAFKPFDTALSQSSLLPKATSKEFTKHTDVCLYNTNCVDASKAMNDSQRRVSNLIKDCYAYVYHKMSNEHKDEYEQFIECNRGTYAFISLIASLNENLISNNVLSQTSSTKEQVDKMSTYFDVLIDYLCDMPTEDKSLILLSKGAGADTCWFRKYQNAIHRKISSYNPEGLNAWLETQNKDLQEEGKKFGRQIEKDIKTRILSKLEDLYGDTWENKVKKIKGKCFQRMDDNDDSEMQDWTDFMTLQDYKEIIDTNWNVRKEDDNSFKTFEDEFSIKVSESFRTKTEKLKWINDLISFSKAWTTTKGRALSQAEVNEIQSISQNLSPNEDFQ
ncbi:dGQHR domain-containing protein [Bacteroides sp. CAG:530]|nr:dGQHR domain-containing protein [Bacteroides sp. CAG:530]